MKRRTKVITVIVCIAALLMTQVSAFASTAEPCYNAVSSVNSYFGIDGKVARYGLDLFSQKTTSFDYVHIDATVRSVGGRIVKTYDENLTQSGRNFTFNKSATLTYSGTYFMHYTLKCYKNGKIIDEITKNTAMDTYTA